MYRIYIIYIIKEIQHSSHRGGKEEGGSNLL